MTASTGWSCARGSAGARSRSCAPMPSTCARPRFQFSQAYMEAHAGRPRRHHPADRPAVPGAHDPAQAVPAASPTTSRSRSTGCWRRSSTRWTTSPTSTRTASCAASSTSSRSTLRTNYFQHGADGEPKPYLSFKLDSPRGRRAAAAAAAGRGLRLSPARGGDPSARRQGGARRHPLVRPARGFPHRGPGPDEGADGEERRHRAGRLEGRLRRQAPPPADAGPRGAAGRRHRVLQDPDARPARHHRQPAPTAIGGAAARTWCATTATIPIWWSPPTRARRPSPTSPTACRADYGFWLDDAFASGGSRRLRPQEDGHHRARRLGIGQAPFPRDRRRHPDAGLHLRRRRRHVGRRVRQRHAAVAAIPSWSPPSTTCTSSSIPNPDPATSFAERERLFDLPRSSWTDYDTEADLAGRRHLRPQGQVASS